MKKLTVLALVALSSASVYAQDIKTIMGANDYNEALNLIKSGEGSLSNEDKAKAYNKVVDLALAKYNKEAQVELSNQVKKENAAYDKEGMYKAAEVALNAAIECDKYDNMPNAKGKVKPKFVKSNAERLGAARANLVNAGQVFYDAKDYSGAATAFGLYVDTNNSKLFNPEQKADQYYTQISYFAALSAYFAKNFAAADKYADIAITDTAYAKDAMALKLSSMQTNMKTQADSLAVAKKLEELYSKYPTNKDVFSSLASLYLGQKKTSEFNALVDKALAADANDYSALIMRGQAYMADSKWENAIADFKKASEVMPTSAPNYIPVVATVGTCYMQLAQDKANVVYTKTKGRIPAAAEKVIIGVYNQAIEYFQKAKGLDTQKQFKNTWAYNLYNCLYRTLGEEDPKTVAAKADLGN